MTDPLQCDTNTQTEKKGGQLDDACMIYKMTAVAKDAPDPNNLPGTEPLGDFKCKYT